MVIEVLDEDHAAVLRQKSGAERLKIVDHLFRAVGRLIAAGGPCHDKIARKIRGFERPPENRVRSVDRMHILHLMPPAADAKLSQWQLFCP